jgi:hypothetical protein
VALDSFCAEHHTQGQTHALEDRSLFYMQFQVGAGVSTLDARVRYAVDLNVALA